MDLDRLCREPFRLFFPLGALLAWGGVLPWVLFGSGVIGVWPGLYHAMTMTQGFLPAIAVGFLGTMIPRRTGEAPLSAVELVLLVCGLLAVPVAIAFDVAPAAQLGYAAVLVTLAQFAIRRFRRARRPPPASFLFIPVGLVLGLAGAALLIAYYVFGAGAEVLAAGRSLAQEGLMLALVLALAPMLTPIVCQGAAIADGAVSPRERRVHLLAALGFVASFMLQHAVSERAGLLLRGGVVLAELLGAARVLKPITVPGWHRRAYRVAMLLMPLGLLAAGGWPAWRVPLEHLTFIGGLSLLVFAMSLHVTFLHTGYDHLARSRPWPVAVVALLTLCAAGMRASAERWPGDYAKTLLLTAATWLVGAVVWAVYLGRLVVRPQAAPVEG